MVHATGLAWRTDLWFWAALGAAFPVWAVMWLLQGGGGNWSWPLRAPQQFALVVFVYPVLEEWVFRGGVQGWLHRYAWGARSWMGISGANVLTSCLFALAHLFAHPPLAAASVLVPSLVFGLFRDRHAGVLTASMLLHGFYNAGYFWLFGAP